MQDSQLLWSSDAKPSELLEDMEYIKQQLNQLEFTWEMVNYKVANKDGIKD